MIYVNKYVRIVRDLKDYEKLNNETFKEKI